MAADYTVTPHNMAEISPYVTVDRKQIVTELLYRQHCYFYDTCSFRFHSNLHPVEAEYLLTYVKLQNGAIVLTRCILMELASDSGMLNQEYIAYIRHIKESGIPVLLLYEEDIFSVMDVAFSTCAAINSYLCWAVRNIKGSVSTIIHTLEQNSSLYDTVIRGKNLNNTGVYRRFFEAVRAHKEPGDNLGEELLAVCLHILSNLPGEEDGKFSIITDDKEAAGKIDTLFKNTAKQHRGKKIGIYSTPKLVQILYRQGILDNTDHIKAILRAGTNGNIGLLGMKSYDLRAAAISITCDELTALIMQPNGIHIVF